MQSNNLDIIFFFPYTSKVLIIFKSKYITWVTLPIFKILSSSIKISVNNTTMLLKILYQIFALTPYFF